MRIPKWMRKPQTAVCHPSQAYCNAARILEVEAKILRRNGDKDGARALLLAASGFYRMGGNHEAPAVAFDWPEEAPSPYGG